jgi:hypothetical protein
MRNKLTTAVIALLIGATLLSAQTEQEVRIPVWAPGTPTLDISELHATVDGTPAEIVRLQDPSQDLLLLLVLDLVDDINRIDLARNALEASLAELPDDTYVGILRAQDGLQVLLDPTNDIDEVNSVIENFTIQGTPGLLETVETASELADTILSSEPVRIAICYITDSNINDYREDFSNPVINRSDRGDMSRRFRDGLVRERISKLAGALASHQAPIFVVHLNYQSDTLNEAYQNGLMQIASTTAGRAVFCRSNNEIAPAIDDMLQTIADHYSLDLLISGTPGSNVQISLDAGSVPLNYRTRYRISAQ